MGFILNGVNVFIKSRVYINKKKKSKCNQFYPIEFYSDSNGWSYNVCLLFIQRDKQM